jgi:hypothetical protein
LKKLILPLLVILLIAQFGVLSSAFAAPTNEIEQKIFVHYAKPVDKPTPPTKDAGSYTVFGSWNIQSLPVHYRINPSTTTLDEAFVIDTIQLAANEWDDGAYSTWGGVSKDLFAYDGTSQKTYADLAWTADDMDGENTIIFGNYPTANVIGVTTIIGNRYTGQILEFDMVLDTDYAWGNADTETTPVMDLQNIVTHELGHGVGLGDLYKRTASQETMYGYGSYDQVIKRSLYFGDIAGIKSLYN